MARRHPDGRVFSFDLDSESWLLAADPRNAEPAVTISQAQYGPKALRSMLAKARSTPGVWIARGDEIDAYWRAAAEQECERAGSGAS